MRVWTLCKYEAISVLLGFCPNTCIDLKCMLAVPYPYRRRCVCCLCHLHKKFTAQTNTIQTSRYILQMISGHRAQRQSGKYVYAADSGSNASVKEIVNLLYRNRLYRKLYYIEIDWIRAILEHCGLPIAYPALGSVAQRKLRDRENEMYWSSFRRSSIHLY